jgi:S1-C subfamily serine protease
MQKYLSKVILPVIMMFFVIACSPSQVKVIEKAKTGVVAIVVNNKDGSRSIGTGFFIKENYIVTATHVVNKAKTINVGMERSGKLYDAEVVHGELLSDVAVIKVKDWAKMSEENNIHYLPIAPYNEIIPYTTVYSIGHPWGLYYSVSKGIISKSFRKRDDTPRWYIQTDAHVFQGNSGGPLIDEQGRVVGINDLMYSEKGGSYGFAVPIHVALKVFDDLVKYDEVRWPHLMVKLFKNTFEYVNPQCAAYRSGLRDKDVVIAIEDSNNWTRTTSSDDILAKMTTVDYNDTIIFTILRDGKVMDIVVKPNYKSSLEYLPLLSNIGPGIGPK